jgi:hypothetical protein
MVVSPLKDGKVVVGCDSKGYMNTITSLGLPTAKIPIYFETDREVLEKALAWPSTGMPERLRIVRIRNTLENGRAAGFGGFK